MSKVVDASLRWFGIDHHTGPGAQAVHGNGIQWKQSSDARPEAAGTRDEVVRMVVPTTAFVNPAAVCDERRTSLNVS